MNTYLRSRHLPRARQRGTILVISLLLLLVMTVLALSASQTTRMQERMAGNARDLDLAFQSGEASLRDAEARLDAAAKAVGSRPDDCAPEADCYWKQQGATPLNFATATPQWWADFGTEYGGNGKQIAEVTEDPQAYSEVLMDVSDSLRKGTPGGASTVYYRHTVRAKGGTDTANAVLQTVQALRYAKQ